MVMAIVGLLTGDHLLICNIIVFCYADRLEHLVLCSSYKMGKALISTVTAPVVLFPPVLQLQEYLLKYPAWYTAQV